MTTQPLREPSSKLVCLDVARNEYFESSHHNNDFDPYYVYYSSAEFECFSDEIKAMVKMMKCSIPETDQFCTRGIECRTKVATRRKSNNRRRAMQAVLEEQFRQEDEGEDDREMLAEIYKGYSSHCLTQAQRMGARDKAAAKFIHEESWIVTKDDESCELTVSTADTYFNSAMSLSSNDSVISDMDDLSLLVDTCKGCPPRDCLET